MAGRFLIALSLLLLAVTPFTERFWTFDRFLRGGQDLEFSLLALILFFCLVLLLARYARNGLCAVFTLRRWLRLAFRGGGRAALSNKDRSITSYLAVLRRSLRVCSLHVPLRI